MLDVRRRQLETGVTDEVSADTQIAVELLQRAAHRRIEQLESVTDNVAHIVGRAAFKAADRLANEQVLDPQPVLGDVGRQFDRGDVDVVVGIVGILLGSGTAYLLQRSFQWSTSISTSAVVMAFMFSAAVGVVFGVWPARRAAMLDPIQALRYE